MNDGKRGLLDWGHVARKPRDWPEVWAGLVPNLHVGRVGMVLTFKLPHAQLSRDVLPMALWSLNSQTGCSADKVPGRNLAGRNLAV